MDWDFIIFSAVKVAVVIGVLLTVVAYSILAERKIAAWVQDRLGPNRCAPEFVKWIPVAGPLLARTGVLDEADRKRLVVAVRALAADVAVSAQPEAAS